jgi:adenylate cyclase
MIFSAVTLFSAAVAQPQLLDDIRNLAFDSFQRVAPRVSDPQAPVKVVGVDENSLKTIGQWPWPRTRLAELTAKLASLGAAAIAFDFIFAEPDRMSAENMLDAVADENFRRELTRTLSGAKSNDEIFARSIKQAPVVLGAMLTAVDGATRLTAKAGLVAVGDDPAPFLPNFPAPVEPIPLLANAASGIGATNWLPDRDQVVRRAPLFGAGPFGVAPSLAMEALRVAQGETTYVLRASNASGETAFGRRTGLNAVKVGAFEIATGPHGDVRPRYAHTVSTQILSAAAALDNRVDRGDIEGRIILVGATAAGLGDIRATPLEPAVFGVEIHAQILESLISGALLSRPDWALGLELVTAAAAFLAVAVLLPRASALLSALFVLTLVMGSFVISFELFEHRALLLDPTFPSFAVTFSYVVGASTLWRFEQAAKQHVRNAFGKFVAPAVVDRLAERPDRLVLGGETRELSILFADLRGFTALSEKMNAQELTRFMNDYLTPMTDAILEREGTIDKYIGDAILAFWNAPLDVEAHPDKALEAALAMRGELAALNSARAAVALAAGGAYEPIAMGVGLTLGPCSVGNMGSIRRFDYSVLGDTVNLASRLERASKAFGADILASGAVCAAAPDFAWLDLGQIVVAGRKEPTAVAALAGDREFARTSAFLEWERRHAAMRRRYDEGALGEAEAAARELAATALPAWRKLYEAFELRCSALRQSPQSGEWSPIWLLESK